MVEFPPVETDLLSFVDRADEEADADRQQLDFGERHLDIAGDDQPFVEHAIEDVNETGGPSVPSLSGVGIVCVFYGTFVHT